MLRLSALLLCFSASSLAADSDHLHAGHGWLAATTKPQARVFINLENEGDAPVTIVGFSSDLGEARLVGPAIKAGAGPQEIPEFQLTSGGALKMEPDGLHIYLSGLTSPMIKGEEIEIVAHFKSREDLILHAEIEDEDAESHSHAGHNH